MKTIMLTGGLGYIGSHTAVQLLEAGYEVIIVDNLSNSDRRVKNRIEKIAGKPVKFYKYDLRDEPDLRKVFEQNFIDAVIHFAGLKAVNESVEKPLEYYENNVESTINLLKIMREYGVNNLVFSSSAAVYGDADKMPVMENFPVHATSPYGRTKQFIEEIIKDVSHADKNLNVAILRYFNPIGAHPSGLLGDSAKGASANLMAYVTKVSVGLADELSIFGNDYNTKDGTGVRDFIHVLDLADGHIAALKKLEEECGYVTYNLGTGTGCTVLELVNTFNKCCGDKVKYVFKPRREGDIGESYASAEKAFNELGWKAMRSLEDACKSAYKYTLKESKKEMKKQGGYKIEITLEATPKED